MECRCELKAVKVLTLGNQRRKATKQTNHVLKTQETSVLKIWAGHEGEAPFHNSSTGKKLEQLLKHRIGNEDDRSQE